ncbi:unnamed protein product [Prorocentrum cordatum]|uniref:H(+)-exporting diphosphatase n=1 Tax=Prorocentrum cordatum TaxID=2364126 RepID=A0ABN9UEH1_9DINO|nr:unnamed protein product [Polarella glacialis]|mmetsp:Transcript_111127/g.301576  ORF Transcript_111127/g.301576 Transcript_111127/m.301576 type:complete len:442 (+) Transcript_111127:69-1394(+)
MTVTAFALALALGAGVARVAANGNVDVASIASELEDVLNKTEYEEMEEQQHRDHQELQLAFCVIDSIQAAVSLGQAGVGIAEATHSCKPKKDPVTGKYKVPKGKEAACAETITFIITSFGHVAVFLSGAASQCAKAINFEAYCAQDVTDLITGVSLLAEAGSGMAANCKGGADYNKHDAENAADADGRRLGGNLSLALPLAAEDARQLAGAKEKSQEEENIAIGMCVFDVLQAAMFLARAGALIEEVIYGCKEYERADYVYDEEQEMKSDGKEVGSLGSVNNVTAGLKKKSLKAAQEYLDEAQKNAPQEEVEVSEEHGWFGRRLAMLGKAPKFNLTRADVKHAQRICAVNVLHLISSFSYVASFLSFAAAKCGETKSYSAACAGSIINVITSLTMVSASAMDFENSCAMVGKNDTDASHTEENPGVRRLGEATEMLANLVV